MRTHVFAFPAVMVMLAASCGAEDSGTTAGQLLEACRSDPTSACCSDDACGDGGLCDFDFICAQEPDHRVTCGEPIGDRKCHPRCDADTPCADPSAACVETTRFGGSDVGQRVTMCR